MDFYTTRGVAPWWPGQRSEQQSRCYCPCLLPLAVRPDNMSTTISPVSWSLCRSDDEDDDVEEDVEEDDDEDDDEDDGDGGQSRARRTKLK